MEPLLAANMEAWVTALISGLAGVVVGGGIAF